MTDHSSSHAEHIQTHFEVCKDWAPVRNHFFERLCAAEFHWFFAQGVDAIMSEFYVPGVSSLLNGIEASIRITIAQVTSQADIADLSPYRVLSNNLIVNGRDIGMAVSELAFPNETDFDAKLASQKPNRIDVEVVRHRNNICHGNVLEFVNRDLGRENSFFTPVSFRPLAFTLLDVSTRWATALGAYRRAHKLLHYDEIPKGMA